MAKNCCLHEDHTQLCKTGKDCVLRNAVSGAEVAYSVASDSTLSLPQRFCKEIGHVAVRTSAETTERWHAWLVDETATARPTPRVVVDISCSGFTPDVSVALFTGKCAEGTKIPVGAQAVPHEFAEAGRSQHESIISVPQ